MFLVKEREGRRGGGGGEKEGEGAGAAGAEHESGDDPQHQGGIQVRTVYGPYGDLLNKRLSIFLSNTSRAAGE